MGFIKKTVFGPKNILNQTWVGFDQKSDLFSNKFSKKSLFEEKKAPVGTPILAQGLYPAGRILRKSAFQKMAEKNQIWKKKFITRLLQMGIKLRLGSFILSRRGGAI